MLELKPDGENIAVFMDGIFQGSVRLYDNPYHGSRRYVELKLENLDQSVSAELFERLGQIAGRPLQAMESSDNTEITAFLASGGFARKRRCYETAARKEDYTGRAEPVALTHARAGEAVYERCCQVMYAHYIETHKGINPWTADYEDFRGILPAEVICDGENGRIGNLAFVYGNEIAYIHGSPTSRFPSFAASLTGWLFSKYDTICFESDDCDWAAMELRSMFMSQDETSFDTYVYDNAHG